MKIIAAFSLLVLLAGCAGHQLAQPTGPLFPLNAGEWQPTQAQLTLRN